MELLLKKWRLPTPKVIISVIGGSKNLDLKPKDRENFNKALIQVRNAVVGIFHDNSVVDCFYFTLSYNEY